MTVRELAQQLALTPLALPDGDRPVEGGYCGDLLSWVMGRAQSGQAWVTIMTNINVVAVASLSGVSAALLAENVEIADDVVQKAAAQGINLLRTGSPVFEACLSVGQLL